VGVPINVLLDDAPLEIFDSYVHQLETKWKKDGWITLSYQGEKIHLSDGIHGIQSLVSSHPQVSRQECRRVSRPLRRL
jgi:hypothetical protein